MRILGMTPPELMVALAVYCIPALVLLLLIYLVVKLAGRRELRRSREADQK